MLTNKKRFGSYLGLCLAIFAGFVLAGCKPAGPRALLDGKRLLDEGKYAPAIEKLKKATSLLGTNANAWNYLGLAYQYGGQATNAIDAYQKALKLNPDLTVVHYNLGCLYLDQNRPDYAKSALTAFTLRQNNFPDAWVKLGTAQYRLRDTAAAEKSFNEALRLSPQNPEVLNNLALVYLQKNRPSDAESYLNACLAQQPNYAPALLNLAVVEQNYRNNRPLALQKYREYLALTPRPANWEEANVAARDLEQELTSASAPRPTTNAPVANSSNQASNPVRTPAVNTNKPVPANPVRTAGTATNSSKHAEPSTTPVKPPAQPALAARSNPSPAVPPPERNVTPEPVRLAEAPVVRAAQDVTSAPQRPVAETTRDNPVRSSESSMASTSNAKQQEKRGFLQKMNPANLFKHSTKEQKGGTNQETNVAAQPSANAEVASKAASPNYPTVSYPRYSYRFSAKPAAGNRTEAERLLAQGVQAQRDRRMKDAEAFYKSSVQADPSYFDAQSGLGLTAYETGDTALALQAYETALAIKPDAFNPRFNFALGLKKSGYVIDAAQELEKLLAGSSNEPSNHLAAAHLVLANLYADQLRQNQSARPHYAKVLELDPQNPQGTAIRYWLRDNP
jgi:tetratricopeptide (TPR) repeat protein